MSKRQDTLWTAFGQQQQQQPISKRQKGQTHEETEPSVARRKRRDVGAARDEDEAGTRSERAIMGHVVAGGARAGEAVDGHV